MLFEAARWAQTHTKNNLVRPYRRLEQVHLCGDVKTAFAKFYMYLPHVYTELQDSFFLSALTHSAIQIRIKKPYDLLRL